MDNFEKFIELETTLKNLHSLKFFATGPLAEIIINKNLYSGNNKEIKEFTDVVMEIDYKDYLFAGRPSLYARVVKDIYREKDDEVVLQRLSRLKYFILEHKDSLINVDNELEIKKKVQRKNKVKKKNNQILEWSSIINPKED
ncbi:hypothetical protein VBH15_09535 [Vagococcus fluvialis]|uniref:hypothetical protein n=1 Tax=Vagococcus fluvialis TaxID=2738 RepID=UPI0037D00D94